MLRIEDELRDERSVSFESRNANDVIREEVFAGLRSHGLRFFLSHLTFNQPHPSENSSLDPA